MRPYICTYSLGPQLARWRAALEQSYPALTSATMLESLAAAYETAVSEAVQLPGVLVSPAGDRDAIERVIQISVNEPPPTPSRRTELCETLAKGLVWLEDALLGDDLLRHCTSAPDIRATYAQRVCSALQRVHLSAAACLHATREPMLTLAGSYAGSVRDALGSPNRWSWQLHESATDIVDGLETMFVTALRAQEQLRWIESAVFGVATRYARSMRVENDYDPFMAIQARAFGRAARLESALSMGAPS
jgi:hypothetical protein